MKNQFLKELKWRGLIHDVTPEIEKYLDKKAKIVLEAMQPGDVKETYSNNDSLKQLIDFKPNTSIEEGIKNFIDWYLSYYKNGN